MHAYTCLHTNACTHVHAHARAHVSTRVCEHMSVHMSVQMYAHMSIRAQLHAQAHMSDNLYSVHMVRTQTSGHMHSAHAAHVAHVAHTRGIRRATGPRRTSKRGTTRRDAGAARRACGACARRTLDYCGGTKAHDGAEHRWYPSHRAVRRGDACACTRVRLTKYVSALGGRRRSRICA